MARGEELTFSVLGDVSAALTWWLLGHQGDLAGSPWMDSSTFKYKGLQAGNSLFIVALGG